VIDLVSVGEHLRGEALCLSLQHAHAHTHTNHKSIDKHIGGVLLLFVVVVVIINHI
jgi:hypothetical protein